MDLLDFKISDEYYLRIQYNLLNNKDTFDNEMFKIISQYEKLKSIETPHISTSDRHVLHTYERSGIHLYSFGDPDEYGFYKMDIAFDRRYIRILKKKFISNKNNKNIDSLIESFKKTLISDISEIVNERISELLRTMKL